MNYEAEVEERLAASMRDHVAGVTLDSAILSRAARHHQRRKVLQRSVFGAGAMAVTAIVALAVTLTGAPQPVHEGGDVAPPPAQEAGDLALTRLVAALEASQSTSYQVKITLRDDPAYVIKGYTYTLEGAYDPATDSGYLRSEGAFEERRVAGVGYIMRGPVGMEIPKFEAEPFTPEWVGVRGFLTTPIDPAALREAMRKREAKITDTGGGTFRFEMTATRQDKKGPTTVSTNGDVVVGADGRAAKITFRAVLTGATETEFTADMEFSNYGVPVKVEKPSTIERPFEKP